MILLPIVALIVGILVGIKFNGGVDPTHAIYYSIGEDTGIIGADWGVNFCVVGLDRSFAYGPGCRAAQP